MPIWYFTSLNTLYGIAVYIYVHVIRFSGNGKECAEAQEFRSHMLVSEVIVFWTTFHILSVPHIFFAFMSTENLEAALVEEEEEVDKCDLAQFESFPVAMFSSVHFEDNRDNQTFLPKHLHGQLFKQ